MLIFVSQQLKAKVLVHSEVENTIFDCLKLHDAVKVFLNPLIPSHMNKTILKFDKVGKDGEILYKREKEKAEHNYTVLTKSGLLMDMSKDLLLPWARLCSKMEFKCLKAYFSSNQQEGFNFEHKNFRQKIYFTIINNRRHLETDQSKYSLFYKAEIIYIVIQCLLCFKKYYKKDLYIQISQTALLDIFFKKINTKKLKIKKENFLNYFYNKNYEDLVKIEKEICKGNNQIKKALRSFKDLRGENFKGFKDGLFKIFGKSGQKNALDAILKEIEEVVQLLKKIEHPNVKIVFSSYLASKRSTIYHSGIVFDAFIKIFVPESTQKRSNSKKKTKELSDRKTLARGGSFRNIVQHYLSVGSNKAIDAFGVTFCGKSISEVIKSNFGKGALIKAMRRSELSLPSIFVASFSEDMVNQKFRICGILWSLGIQAFYSITCLKGSEYISKCKELGISFVLLMKPGMLNLNQKVKFKDIIKDKENEVSVDELEAYIRKVYLSYGFKLS